MPSSAAAYAELRDLGQGSPRMRPRETRPNRFLPPRYDGKTAPERLAEDIPGSKLMRLPNVGRLVPEEAPETLVNLVIEFDSVEKAIATIESAEYRAAQKLLEGAVEREVRIVEGV